MERRREAVNFIPVVLLTAVGFASVYAARSSQISAGSLGYGLLFLGIFVAVHAILRIAAPHADPYLMPITGLLAAMGIMMIYRIDPSLAAAQATWLLVGVGLFTAIIIFLRNYRKLDDYIYLLGIIGILLLVVTIVAGTDLNGSGVRLWLKIGGIVIQPGEFSKVLITIFLAGYLHTKRELLSTTTWRFAGVPMPPLKHLGPLLTVWGVSFGMLLLMNDLGPSLLLFGIFLGMVYAATGRVTYPAIGVVLITAAGTFAYFTKAIVHLRVDLWLNPWTDATNKGYQLAQSLFAIGDGGLFGTGLGKGYLLAPNGNPIIPALHTDFIFSAIAEELGLVGASGLIILFLLLSYRGFKIAVDADDGFSKLLAAGISIGFALQTFFIIGGVMKLIPLTGITLPFVSYGGSSIVSNFASLALLVLISNRTNSQRARTAREARLAAPATAAAGRPS
ncbi:MAG: FtsW/RodA/SpoVE family cell cycle protein [Actinobacteria bacterium]|nr:FtsW/RodA/SpoVE family cell cycle protein [Actinomycetota bacterium]